MAQQHRIANLCDGSTERSLGLHDIYEDEDGSMREEVRAIDQWLGNNTRAVATFCFAHLRLD